jgi:predicted TIM-barrel fold metal-dependent hydrolase
VNGKIVLEEHIALDGFEVDPPLPESELKTRIYDTDGLRLQEMDENGVEMMVLSLTSPGVQGEPEADRAVELALRANSLLAEVVARHPDRYAGFAAVPLQDPVRAADELERCVTELGFKGAMVNGYTSTADPNAGLYYDDPTFSPFWEEAQALDVPVYLHPREVLPDQRRIYDGYPELLAAAWGFGVETGTHAIRLILSGLFDRYPRLNVILGHLGETLPFAIWRLEHRFTLRPHGKKLERPVSDYLRENFYVTTSGNFSSRALATTIAELGVERVLFSVDYPYESLAEGARWFDSASVEDNDRERIGRTNAERLLRL